jgi:hypothetical protein
MARMHDSKCFFSDGLAARSWTPPQGWPQQEVMSPKRDLASAPSRIAGGACRGRSVVSVTLESVVIVNREDRTSRYNMV